MMAPPESINCNVKILELTEGSFNQNINLVAFKKRLGIPQLYEPQHKIIKAINIQGSLSSRLHALICYSPFFHHVNFDKSFFFLTWNEPKIKMIYKKYECSTSDKIRGLKKVVKAKLFQVSNFFQGLISPSPRLLN